MDPKQVYTTVCFLVAQFNAGQKPFMAFDNVPKAVSEPRSANGSNPEH
jgi:hypothetical protein